MEYMALMKEPDLQPLWKRGFINEVGRLFQGIRNIPDTTTCFFDEINNIPKDRQITQERIFCD
jgi:MoxR-like ATPase